MDLQMFCREDSPGLKRPFRIGAFVYASDGKIAIRVPLESMPEVEKNERAPGADLLAFDGVEDYIPLPTIASAPIGCPVCDGMGRSRTCPKCHGTGEIECTCSHCDNEHSAECPDCEGTGKTEALQDGRCAECKGSGNVYDKQVGTAIGRRHIADWLLSRISTLEGVEIESAGGPGSPARFRFKGGVGLVMPLYVP